MKVIAYGASTSSTSINKALATYAANQIDGAEVKVLDINDFPVPMFSEDKEKEIGQSESAQAFLDEIASADALVISFAEHNGHYPAAYKNLFDWAARINNKVFQEIPAVYLSTSPGPGGAQSSLSAAVTSAPFFAGNVIESLSVPSFYDHFDLATGQMTNPEFAEKITQAVNKLTV
ncbi:NADPH-dependent FMN reductase [Vibrio palustris]|uniref:NAD(P)H:quinone oxidoreductase n=1 Tax=Vibrio palustris TaxID=1918946 RepID=A0A1R4B0C7_9VIBR|nr:NADPH-dependent FMN reductase [Vibrio palustris]SJL82359.1 NAD(P)H:quinone oxidoreductase [Vibrio palustris]